MQGFIDPKIISRVKLGKVKTTVVTVSLMGMISCGNHASIITEITLAIASQQILQQNAPRIKRLGIVEVIATDASMLLLVKKLLSWSAWFQGLWSQACCLWPQRPLLSCQWQGTLFFSCLFLLSQIQWSNKWWFHMYDHDHYRPHHCCTKSHSPSCRKWPHSCSLFSAFTCELKHILHSQNNNWLLTMMFPITNQVNLQPPLPRN